MAITFPSRNYAWHDSIRAPYVKIIDNKAVKFSDVKVHSFSISDIDDPDVYAGQPLFEWRETEAGQWVMEHAVDQPYWIRQKDLYNYGYRYHIIARMSEADQIYWQLKWGNK